MKLRLFMLAAAATAIFAGCGEKTVVPDTIRQTTEATVVETGAKADAETSAKAETGAEAVTKTGTEAAGETAGDITFASLMELMGKSAKEVKTALGEGESTLNEDKILISMDYTFLLFGENTDVSLIFNQNDYGADLMDGCNIQLKENNLERYKEALVPSLGEPVKVSEKSYAWETEGLDIMLANPYDMPYIEMTVKTEEAQ